MALCLPHLLAAQGPWTRQEQLPATDVPSLLVHEGMLYAGTDSTVWRSTDGADWLRGATLPDPGYFVDALFHDGSTLFAGTGGNGLFVSPVDGITWQHFSQGLSGLGSTYISDVAVFDGDLWCATMGAGVFRRSGATWVNTTGLDPSTAGNVDFLKVVDGRLWAGAGGNGFLWRMDPGAGTFTPVQVAPLVWDAFMITDLVRSGDDLLLGSTYGAYRSSDGGQTWTPATGGMVTGGLMRFLRTDQALFALVNGASSRLYRSMDHGVTWQLIDHMVPTYAMAAVGERLYIGRTDGLWYRDDLVTSMPDPQPAGDMVVYPNPAHDELVVRMGKGGDKRYRLFNADGRLVQEGRFSGAQGTIPLTYLESGTYVLEVRDGYRVQQQRFIKE